MIPPFDMPTRRSWPPRAGNAFVLLWTAGLLWQMILTRLFTAGLAQNSAGYLVSILTLQMVVCVAHAWQAWLLFGRDWRSGVWTLLPMLLFVAPKNFQWVQLTAVLIPCLEAALLAGMRRRSVLWVFAAGAQIAFAVFVGSMLNTLTLGWHAFVPVSLPQLTLPPTSLLWLLTQMAAACVLAFWMPPIPRRFTSASPPPLPPSP